MKAVFPYTKNIALFFTPGNLEDRIDCSRNIKTIISQCLNNLILNNILRIFQKQRENVFNSFNKLKKEIILNVGELVLNIWEFGFTR